MHDRKFAVNYNFAMLLRGNEHDSVVRWNSCSSLLLLSFGLFVDIFFYCIFPAMCLCVCVFAIFESVKWLCDAIIWLERAINWNGWHLLNGQSENIVANIDDQIVLFTFYAQSKCSRQFVSELYCSSFWYMNENIKKTNLCARNDRSFADWKIAASLERSFIRIVQFRCHNRNWRNGEWMLTVSGGCGLTNPITNNV